LDDCFITGARMVGYQTRLRQLSVKARLHYLVGLARPDNPHRWRDFKGKLQHRLPKDRHHFENNTISAVLEVCIPNWQEGRCPWCQEELLYQRLQQSGEGLSGYISERQRLLANKHDGLRDNLFFGEETLDQIKLFSGSIFAVEGCNQAEVFASVAASIQNLRTHSTGDAPVLGPRRYPVATVLDHDHYLRRTYTDSILRASFLRGATWEELVYPDDKQEEQRTGLISELLRATAPDVCNLRLEILLAHAMNKCYISKEIEPSELSPTANELLALIRSQQSQ